MIICSSGVPGARTSCCSTELLRFLMKRLTLLMKMKNCNTIFVAQRQDILNRNILSEDDCEAQQRKKHWENIMHESSRNILID